MKEILLTILRERNSTPEDYRDAAEKLGYILAAEASDMLEKESFQIHTPLTYSTGFKYKNPIILIPVLRSGIALLNPFLKFFAHSKVGFVGIKRDEETAIPYKYYQNLPQINPEDDILLLDPMIATGGSAMEALKMLRAAGVQDDKIIFVGIIAAPEGMHLIRSNAPNVRMIIAQIDDGLNQQKFILPGLGDFGDRYFGTMNIEGNAER